MCGCVLDPRPQSITRPNYSSIYYSLLVCRPSALVSDMIMLANPVGIVRAQLLLADVTEYRGAEFVLESIIPLEPLFDIVEWHCLLLEL